MFKKEEEIKVEQALLDENCTEKCDAESEVVACEAPVKGPKKFINSIDNYFGITKSGSNFKTEVIAGITTFMAMAYILIVNPDILGAAFGPEMKGALYVATCLGAIVGTLMMSLHAKHPFALASGMGLNAYFAFTIVLGSNGMISPANGLFIILISGVVFLILTLVGVREKIVDAIPKAVKDAIPAGIGLFIAFIGLQNAKIIKGNSSTLVALMDLNFLKVPFTFLFPAIVTFIAFMLIAVLSKLKVKGAILWGILGGTALYYIMGYAGGFYGFGANNEEQVVKYLISIGSLQEGFVLNPDTTGDVISAIAAINPGALAPDFANMDLNPLNAFSKWGTDLVGIVFTDGWKFSGDAATITGIFISAVLAFAMVDMFDTVGTLLGTAKKADMLDKDGKLPRMNRALLSDSIATCTGAIFGTTTVTTFVESSAGVAEGGRTGFTSLVVAFLFFIAMFITPLAYLIPSCATAAALIYVGVLMISTIKDIDFADVAVAVPAFLTVSMMVFTYNISFGIGLGLISHCVIMLCTGRYFKTVDGEKLKYLKQDALTIVLAILFTLNFILVSH